MVIKQEAEDQVGNKWNLRIRHLEFVGKGTFGLVYKAHVWTEEEGPSKGQTAAIKFSKDSDGFKEFDLLSKCDHPCILKLFYFFVWENRHNLDKRVNLVLELLDNDLYRIMKNDWSPQSGLGIYTEVYMYQCFQGLAYLDKLKIGHRDIKPENLLCRKDNGVLKISDFGCGKKFVKNQFSGHHIGTRYYRAPELLLGSQMYGTAVDWWSAMCVLAEVISYVPLFHGRKNDQNQLQCIFDVLGAPSTKDIQAMKVKNGGPKAKGNASPILTFEEIFKGVYFPSRRSKDSFLELCQSVIRYDPNQRLHPSKVCKHEYFYRLHERNRLPNGNPLPDVVLR